MSRYTEWLDACNHGWEFRNANDGISEIRAYTQTLATTEDPETVLYFAVEQVIYSSYQRTDFTYYSVVGWVAGRGPLIGNKGRVTAIDWEERVLDLGMSIDWKGDKQYPDLRGQVLRLIDMVTTDY